MRVRSGPSATGYEGKLWRRERQIRSLLPCTLPPLGRVHTRWLKRCVPAKTKRLKRLLPLLALRCRL